MVTFNFPNVPADVPDNVAGSGTKIALTGCGPTVAFLGPEVGITRLPGDGGAAWTPRSVG